MTKELRVLLVTSLREECGIREYGRCLAAAVGQADPGIEVVEFPETNPIGVYDVDIRRGLAPGDFHIVHVNHHAALHSQWKREHIEQLQRSGLPVVVTQHDTFETAEIMRERGFQDFRGANCLVVHEPVEGLHSGTLLRGHARDVGAIAAGGSPRVVYLRQPVPAVVDLPPAPATKPAWPHVLGLFGFDFPWKGFDQAIKAAAQALWGVLLFSPGITIERARELQKLHPAGGLEIVPCWTPAELVVRSLAKCRATAFLYSTGNSGTSGAVRLGLAARRPLLLTEGCRQFWDLESLPEAQELSWTSGEPQAVARELTRLEDPQYWILRQARVERLANLESWTRGGEVYAGIYRALQAAKERSHAD